jgi:peroxiredoxin
VTTLTELPKDLPVPVDDGACDHLLGIELPSVSMPSTTGGVLSLAECSGYVVVYCYPMTGRPDRALPDGWDQIPGARGCTPQSCSFKDHFQELKSLGASVFGLSTQTSDYQREVADRLHLPFPLLSDEHLNFATALNLPTFDVDGMELIKRITLIAKSGRIEKVFYPVFPPTENAQNVLAWLRAHSA